MNLPVPDHRSYEMEPIDPEPPKTPHKAYGSLAYFQGRAVRVVTRLPEIAYAIGRHLILVTIMIVVAGAITWGVVTNLPIVYEGRAQLLVNPDTGVVTERGEGPYDPTVGGGFINSQVKILESGSVHRLLFGKLMAERKKNLLPLESLAPSPTPSPIDDLKEGIRDLRDRAKDLLDIKDPTPRLQGVDQEIQVAIESFKRRSEVVPGNKSMTIDLVVHGTNPEQIEEELNEWINAYIGHVVEIDQQSQQNFLTDRIVHYEKEELDALNNLEEYKKKNRGVTQEHFDDLTRQIETKRLERNDVRHLLTVGEFSGDFELPLMTRPTPPVKLPETPEAKLIREIDQKIKLYEDQRLGLEVQGYKPQSPDIQQVDRMIAALEEEKRSIEAAQLDPPALPDGESGDVVVAVTLEEQRKRRRAESIQRLEERDERLTADLERLIGEKSQLKDKLDELKELADKYQRLRRRREEYASMKQEFEDVIAMKKTAIIKVADEPAVSSKPYNYHPLRFIALGSLGGLGLGLLMALGLEILCTRVRFKHDISSDFDLPVVGVIPKR